MINRYILLLLVLVPLLAHGQWSTSSIVNNPVCTATQGQQFPKIVSDGADGAIITWYDYRNLNADIYAQRINKDGSPQWTTEGVPVSTAPFDQFEQVIVSDGAGGAVIAWYDSRIGAGDVYSQRINASGVPQWTTDGVPICTGPSNQYTPMIASDGAGGAIITWTDFRDGVDQECIYAQRVDSSGVIQWATNGIAICTTMYTQYQPVIVSDDSGGAIITWTDGRDGVNFHIYAQRVNSAGVVQWTTNGIPISVAPNGQEFPAITPDGSGGAVISWHDWRNGAADIYAQRVDRNGIVKWVTNGVGVCTAANSQQYPTLASDGSGGAIITWDDSRGTAMDVYAQRINGQGVAQWTGNGVAICTAGGNQLYPMVVSDGLGGAIITWTDGRAGYSDVYAQRIDGTGAIKWTSDGLPVSTASDHQGRPDLLPDGIGGAIITWHDYRGGGQPYSDIYAQKVDQHGLLGDPTPSLVQVRDIPNDQGGHVSLKWNRSFLDAYPQEVVTYYSIWRAVPAEPSLLATSAKFIAPRGTQQKPNQGIYRERKLNGITTYWEWIANSPVHYLPQYQYTAPTVADSTASGTPVHYFFVSAHSGDPFVFWDSNIDSTYSVDNLAPIPPAGILASVEAGPQVALTWNQPTDRDIGHYDIYRSTTSGFTPTGGLKIGMSASSSYTDESISLGHRYYYRLVAFDVHGNRSQPSTEASAMLSATQTFQMRGGWNLVSLPLSPTDCRVSVLYPTAASQAMCYQGTYAPVSNLEEGTGYWLRFNESQTVPVTGFLRSADTVTLVAGWNMIGSISSSLSVSSIASIPGGLLTSEFFGYMGSYVPVTTLEPGGGYWVKVMTAAQLILSPEPLPEGAKIAIQATTERPPLPPNEADGQLPKEFSLGQNYPNPFNPGTTIKYQLPLESHVTVKVYTIYGQEIEVLKDGVEAAGFKQISWNASKFASGTYFYRLEATSTLDPTKSFVSVMKMVLVK